MRTLRAIFLEPLGLRFKSELFQHLQTMLLVRVTVLSLLLSATSWSFTSEEGVAHVSDASFRLIALIYFVSLANAIVVRLAQNLVPVALMQISLDVALSTVAISYTGGAISPLFFLYLLSVFGGAYALSYTGALLAASLSGICYGLIAAGIISGNLIQPSVLHFLTVYTGLVVVGCGATFLSKRADSAETEAEEHRELAQELSWKKEQLFNDLPDGMITVDLTEMITNINRAAAAVLGISDDTRSELVGANLNTVFTELSNANLKSETGDLKEVGEFSISADPSAEEKFIYFETKPLTSPKGEEIGSTILLRDVSELRNMARQLSLHEKVTRLIAEASHMDVKALEDAVPALVAESSQMKSVLELVQRVATSDASALVTGESGTGKEVVARTIHTCSERGRKPFVAINCGAMPENLLESELFGHKKGSFTGAINDSIGLLRQAEGGTVFLDEIGELPMSMQTKLLRVLQERKVRPVGGLNDIAIDVRIIAATNKDLRKAIAENKFREDLFYRLNVVEIMIPALRERKEDIPALVTHFIHRHHRSGHGSRVQISPKALELLMRHGFPGNIRELENIIERALVFGGDAILPEHLPPDLNVALAGKENALESELLTLPLDLEAELAKIEQALLKQALDQTGGIKKHAAELLGLNFRSLRYRLKKYGLASELEDQ
ncbi:sigma 54-interacting transcriptional regulator [bacterium]|nr:sigma 54-interacting transcriptional regulator [bacterium]